MKRQDIKSLLYEALGKRVAEVREQVVARKLKSLEVGSYFVHKKPFYISQLASAKKSSIDGFYGAIKDKDAAYRFGTKDLKEFSYWAWRACGIVGLQMVLKTVHGNSFDHKTIELIKEGYELGGYDTKIDTGWFHKSIAKLAEKYKLKAELKKFVPASEIALIISKGSYVLASTESLTGGHFLLMYGFKMNSKKELSGFWIHDSNDFEDAGEGKYISKNDFKNLSTRRIISLKKK
ncbi:hypothetical protein KKH23_00530 [Patescibacteria group bacterium]|nr:hypothetical protein [Patescibacteria group bacterium]MBU0776961.1 hypothetical protein [Patescibacteria group bacterium]MBU0845679.1 hypothetical protein [Patescibacteria group bacterium]MBU0922990.1 hypothetical protein [Patescibacteria group bacterium]MBU1066923.1 hypothetical protein [Patescibacteria group bacterium]